MIWLKRIILVLIVLLLLVVSVTVFIAWKYEKELKAYALDAVESIITTKISYNKNVVLSIWQDFPLIAVEISDIQIQDSFKSDTLLKAKKAFVQFDIVKLIQNNISIEGIRVADGFLRIKRNEENNWNFRVWKTPEERDPDSKTNVSIEILTLENVRLDYDDRVIDMNIRYQSYKSKIKGRFTDENQRFSLSLNGHVHHFNTVGADRIVDVPLKLAGVLDMNGSKNRHAIEMGNIVLDGNEMVFDAEWARVEAGTYFSLDLQAENIEPFKLLPHIWPQVPESITKLQLRGKADLVFSLKGPFNQTQGPQLDATLRLRDGGLIFRNTEVNDLKFEGKLFIKDIKQSKAVQISFDSFELKTPQGAVTGNGTLTDLNNPMLKLHTVGRSRLEEILLVANVQEGLKGAGNIDWNIDFDGPLGPSFKTSIAELKQMRWSGNINLSETEVQFSRGIPDLQKLNAKIEITPEKTKVTECSGRIGHMDFDGSLQIARLMEILTDSTAAIDMIGNVHINQLDIQKIPSEWQYDSSTESGNEKNRAVSMIIAANIDRLDYNDFSATSVTGNIKLTDDKLDVSELQFKAMDGTIASDLTYEPSGSGYLLHLNAKLRNIDMQRALLEWKDFGQNGITSKNLKGRASAILSAEIHMDKDYKILKEKLKVESDIEITGGELIKYEPLLGLSKFISVDELDLVKFDTIRNQLSIHDNRLFIPRMTVSSNILNVDVFGEHGFDQEMDYHVNLLLNDLLRRKSKKKETFDGHEIIDEKGKTRLFLWIRGRPGNIKIGFDKKEVRKKLKDDFKQEGKSIKQLFKEEFGGAEPSVGEQSAGQFKLEDSNQKPETESTPTKNLKTEENPMKKKGFFSTEPDKEETEGGFEIEFTP